MYIGTIFIGILNIFPKYLMNYHGLYQSFKSLKWGTVESVLACYDHPYTPPPTLIFLPNLWFVSTAMSSADRYNSSFCFNNVEMKLNKKKKIHYHRNKFFRVNSLFFPPSLTWEFLFPLHRRFIFRDDNSFSVFISLEMVTS